MIDRRQVWIRTLSHGPAGQSLNATYKNAESYAFQDELGRVVAQVCETVPHGVLLFLPSYAMLNKLSERWKQSGGSRIWQRMSAGSSSQPRNGLQRVDSQYSQWANLV